MSDLAIARFRQITMAVTGAVTLAYSILAVLWATPAPMAWYVPTVLGLGIAVTMVLTAFVSPKSAEMAFDEGYRHIAQKAASLAYWVSLFGFAVFFLSFKFLGLNLKTIVASFGTFMGAAYLLPFAYLDWKFG
jgi:hypothetical protein